MLRKNEKIRSERDDGTVNIDGLQSPWRIIIKLLAAFMSAFYLYSAAFGAADMQYHLGVFVALTFALVFITYPTRRGTSKSAPSLLDIGLAGLALVVCGYFMLYYPDITRRLGAETQADLLCGLILLVLSIEMARRVHGWMLPGIAIAFILFTIFGRSMPDVISHRGFSLERIALFNFISEDGLFGMIARVFVNYVIVFIFFGAFLSASGTGAFFIDIATALAGKRTGGPAKVSIVASMLLGSISGSAIANTVTTGSLTIPLMKKTGYPKETAGAIEASASIGGMFLPPVMGAGVFIMVELTGIPYQTLIAVSIVPAILYFASIWWAVHFEAKRLGLRGLSDDEVPKVRSVLRKRGILSLPLLLVIALLVYGFTPAFAAFWGVLATIPCSWGTKETRMGIGDIYAALYQGGLSTLVIGSIVGVISIILGMISLTGMAQEFTSIFLSVSSGNLLLAIILIALASLVIGMGLPVTASYIVIAVLAVPALNELGVALIAAHMIVYWLSQDSNITPPVCIAAYAGAAIAKADPFTTGVRAMKLSKMLYIMPLLFAFSPMLMNGEPFDIAVVWLSALIGVFLQGAVSAGYFRTKTNISQRILLLIAMVLCYWPNVWTTVLGIIMSGVVYLWQRSQYYQSSYSR
ncbi:TRAP transporter permease [Halomonas sp. AOP22-C1-8]|uniref:TRAP transporter fused permease subunit n=1 Tax=Halomonas citrativorans TaxID=2742612 RepID=A0ABR9FAZ1_9GAMM|nr:TRAP transporter fused permease subunit [Halomonas citrativorans]MBE0402907.1 TRAP transporter fused permease subunit [Halomonas citrativorans]